ncbi:MAG: right-handed parallel beta-helix repeat-containing protein [Kiloniellales bacterium]|nr:right-handed parallel beta-helix repeat-containing protein [Kiloniellales bacterium]
MPAWVRPLPLMIMGVLLGCVGQPCLQCVGKSSSSASFVVVDPGGDGDVATLAEAITQCALDPNLPCLICVSPGMHLLDEEVEVRNLSKVHISGAGSTLTTIRAQGNNGLTIQNSHLVTISDLAIDEALAAVKLKSGTELAIRNTEIRNSDVGVELLSGADVEISQSYFYANREGIRSSGIGGLLIGGNVFADNGQPDPLRGAIHFVDELGTTLGAPRVVGNVFRRNVVAVFSEVAPYFPTDPVPVIQDNFIGDSVHAGIYFVDTSSSANPKKRAIVARNQIRGNPIGIRIENSHVQISDNKFESNGKGVQFHFSTAAIGASGGSETNIDRSVFESGESAIVVGGSGGIRNRILVRGNTIQEMEGHAIVRGSNNVALRLERNSVVESAGDGIYVISNGAADNGTELAILGNTISDGDANGVNIVGSAAVISVHGNIILNNDGYGLQLSDYANTVHQHAGGGAVISHNTVYGSGAGKDIRVNDCSIHSHVAISLNMVDIFGASIACVDGGFNAKTNGAIFQQFPL